jgi:hypothetical protein
MSTHLSGTLSNLEKTNLLFKKLLGKPSTLTDREFFQEPNRPARINVFQSQIFKDDIPATASTTLTSLTDTSLDDNGNTLAGSYAGKSDGIIKRYIKIPLTPIDGTNGKAYEALEATTSHPSGNNDDGSGGANGTSGTYDRVTQDTIPFNFDTNGSYEIKLYKSNGQEIPFGYSGGEWIYDYESGIVSFYEYSNISGIDESNPPLVSFYRYIGEKGVSVSTINKTIFDAGDKTGTGDDITAAQIDTRDLSTLGLSAYSQAFQFGGNYNGSWRMVVSGGDGNQAETKFRIQVRIDGTWVDKMVTKQS